MQPSLVSIVIPAFQADRHIGETLEHIAWQSYPDWELIVVEDASVGETEAIVGRFRERNPDHRIVYIRHDVNQGPSGSRNTAIRSAEGEFIAFVDSDDLWMPNHLRASVEGLARHEVDVVYSGALMFEDHTGHLMWVWGPTKEERDRFPEGLFHRSFITPSTVVMRRTAVDRAGPFDTTPELQGCEDVDFWLRCVSAGIRFHCIPGCHCLYRKGHAGAATSRMDRILIRHSWVLHRHYGMPAIPLKKQRDALSRQYLLASLYNARNHPRMAAKLTLRSWRIHPMRLDRLAVGVAATGYGLARKTAARVLDRVRRLYKGQP